MSLKNYIQNKKSDNFTYKGIEVIIKDKIEQDVSIEKVLKIVTSKIPNHLTSNFKRLYIGDFENMREREIQAFYSNKSIYITNRLKNDEDLLDDLIHEIYYKDFNFFITVLSNDGFISNYFSNTLFESFVNFLFVTSAIIC